jgi:hypothetical protein
MISTALPPAASAMLEIMKPLRKATIGARVF